MVHKLAYCVSYTALERNDTVLQWKCNEKPIRDNIIIPSNIQMGEFVQFVADKNDINKEM